jgi:tRNA (guanine6-N2)-methyltransferase
MQFLATTVPGLEGVASDELDELLGVEAKRHHRGMVAFEADPLAAFECNEHARSLHRVLVEVTRGSIVECQDAYELAAAIPVAEYLGPDQAIAVRGTRHGTHEFTSVDVAERVGQALVDETRAAFGERVAVDLDEPDVVFRAYVRDDQFLLAVDATGERSLHRRHWRECEHDAPLRPSIAHAMLRLVDYDEPESLCDPMCGGGTIPIEATEWARREPPGRNRASFAAGSLRCLPDDGRERVREAHDPRDVTPDVTGMDHQDRWVRCATVNRREAGLEDVVDIQTEDATTAALDADVIAVDLPFGIRTTSELPTLYRGFCENLESGDWDRFVAITTRPDLLDLPFTRQIDIRYGRLEATVVVVER